MRSERLLIPPPGFLVRKKTSVPFEMIGESNLSRPFPDIAFW